MLTLSSFSIGLNLILIWNYLHTVVEELHLIDNQSQVIGFSMGTVVTSKAAKRTQELGLPILARWKTKFMSGPFLYTLCFLDMLGYLLTLPIVYDMVIVFKINIVRHDNCMIIIWQLHFISTILPGLPSLTHALLTRPWLVIFFYF